MNRSFNINISGGNVSLGAAAQGDNSVATGTASTQVSIEKECQQLYSLIETLAQRSGVSAEAQAAAEVHAKDLVQAVKAQDGSKVSSALELVQKNFSWAYPALKDFVKFAWPALLAAIGA